MIENSHKRNNALSIIFTIHHSQSDDIIDEILTHTLCSVDGIAPAKLDYAETKVFNELLSEIPSKIESENTVAEERLKEREHRDILETKQVDESPEDIEKGDHEALLGQVFKCRKNIEILSQILKNKSGDLEIPQLTEIVETICDAGLRLAKLLLAGEKEFDEMISYIKKQYFESEDYDPEKHKDEQFEDIKRIFMLRAFIWVISNVELIVSAIGKPGIRQIIDDLAESKNTPAYEMIKYFYSLDTAKKFEMENRDHLHRLVNKYDKDEMFFLFKVLSMRTQYYINTHSIKGPVHQAVCSTLEIPYKAKLPSKN
jgi:hypothetical protein